MRTTPYNKIPSVAEWKTDSSVSLARRVNDPVLDRIDNLLDAFSKAKDAGETLYIQCEIYFASNYWLRNFKQANNLTTMNAKREPAIRALFRCIVKKLAFAFDCGVQALPNALELYFGRSLSEHGKGLDRANNFHYFLKRAELEKFKLRFKAGRVYQLPWREYMKNKDVKLQPANSELIHDQTKGVVKGDKFLRTDWACFVMSMSRDLYMAPHFGHLKAGSSIAGVVPKYHSSHLAGLPVLCSGSILIQDGWVQGLRNDSGHYQPTNAHLVNVLEHLQMMLVDLKGIEVVDYGGAVWANGEDFLSSHGNWATAVTRARRNDPKMRQWEIDVKTKYKGGKGTAFRSLVEEHYANLTAGQKQGGFYDLWGKAYREVAIALSEVDKSYWTKAGEKPFPPPPPSKRGRSAPSPPRNNQSKFQRRKNAWESGAIWKK